MKKIISFFKRDIGKFSSGAVLFLTALIFDLTSFKTVSLVLYLVSLLVSGIDVYIDAFKGIMRRDFLDEKFLMSIASVGAMIIGEEAEGVAVMLFFILGEMFESRAVKKSRNKIRALMDICPDEAVVIRDGVECTVDADDVQIGETVIIKAGDRVAVDCKVLSGFADADTSALTGESVPRAVGRGSILESGTIIIGGALECEVIREASESSAMRILDTVENATERKSKEENFISAFSKVYTPIVVSLALIMAIVPPLFKLTDWSESVYRALIFLVVSCPCALVISVPLAFFGGIGAAASRGILFKGGNFFSAVANTKTVVFDKTGTLTSGEFKVKQVIYSAMPKEELIKLSASVENYSNHPIAISIRKEANSIFDAEDVKEIAGKGTVGKAFGKRIAVGNELLMRDEGALVPEEAKRGSESRVYVAVNGEFSGAILISDSIKKESQKSIEMLRNIGISRTVILSGDSKTRVEEVGEALGIDEVKSELLPEDKFSELEKIISSENGKTMYIGDGINDAPSLALADVGVAMGGIGSDSAIECADLVIMSDNLARLPEAIRIARKTLKIAKQNIVFALGVKILVMILSAIGIANMWLAVFADVGVAVLAILNSMRTLISEKRN